MKKLSISDISLRRSLEYAGSPLPFRVKIDVAKLLANLGADVIEAPQVAEDKSEHFLVKSLSSAVSKATLCVPVNLLDEKSPERTWEALREAKHPRLQVCAPVSTVRMEYLAHIKSTALLPLISERIKACKALCPEVEFVAEDFGRADKDFLSSAINEAVQAGATVVTLFDMAGNLLPEQFAATVSSVKKDLPKNVKLGVFCSNDLYLSDACAVAAVIAGADEVKTMAFGNSTVSIKRFPRILDAKREECKASCSINLTRLDRVISQIRNLCDVSRSKSPTAVSHSEETDDLRLGIHDDKPSVLKAIKSLGYDLDEEDADKVYDAFTKMVGGESSVGAKELEAIVSSVAYQVPPTYVLESYLINSGNIMTPTCQIRLRKKGELAESVAVGDGPVDAAFLAIEKLVGTHFELDDFKIRAVTEGREAMGETIVRLRHEGKVYPGRGVSKDIVASSVMAYISAVNKIAYESEEVR